MLVQPDGVKRARCLADTDWDVLEHFQLKSDSIHLSVELLHATVHGVKSETVERRENPRFPLRAKVGLIPYENGACGKAVEVWTRDVSASGVGVLYAKPMRAGRKFIIRLPRRDDSPVLLVCTVRNCTELAEGIYAIGASFAEITAPPEQPKPKAAPQSAPSQQPAATASTNPAPPSTAPQRPAPAPEVLPRSVTFDPPLPPDPLTGDPPIEELGPEQVRRISDAILS